MQSTHCRAVGNCCALQAPVGGLLEEAGRLEGQLCNHLAAKPAEMHQIRVLTLSRLHFSWHGLRLQGRDLRAELYQTERSTRVSALRAPGAHHLFSSLKPVKRITIVCSRGRQSAF